MLKASRVPSRNWLLASLSPSDLALLTPLLEPVPLKRRLLLEAQGRRTEHVYFIEDGVASVIVTQPNGKRAGIGFIGWEGMSGTSVVLANDRSPHSVYVQVGGLAMRSPAQALVKAIATSGTLNALLLRYAQSFMVQTAHTAVAAACAKLDERLARWILMAHDRTKGDTLLLTHEALALMLGVRRASVTEALHDLKNRGLLELERGVIAVIDRDGIEQVAGHYYGMPEAEYRRLISEGFSADADKSGIKLAQE
jgi:CRP-like cAMP-binding protein